MVTCVKFLNSNPVLGLVHGFLPDVPMRSSRFSCVFDGVGGRVFDVVVFPVFRMAFGGMSSCCVTTSRS